MVFDGFHNILEAYKKAGFDNPLNEALGLLDVLSNGVVSEMNDAFPSKTGIALHDFIDRRCKGMPLEYALGHTTFMGKRFSCSPAALIPRRETELLAKTAIALAKRNMAPNGEYLIIDMGTGSGNLAVSMAAALENAHVLASDVSSEAIELAQMNVSSHNLQSRISLFTGDLFAPLADAGYLQRVDMVISNPPYIPSGMISKMLPEILNYEPVIALNAGAYGIDIFREIIAKSPDFLKPGGMLVMEIGIRQEKFVDRLLKQSRKYKDITHHTDQSGEVRVISAVAISKQDNHLSIVKMENNS